MSRRKVVVTAGPTREHVDPVRYISNESSGRMGFELAAAAARAGDRVVLVAGPVHLETPPGVTRVDVVSARDMHAAVRAAFLGAPGRGRGHFGPTGADALYMAAAVGDWRPRRRRAGKWRAKDGGDEVATLELVRNPDILASVGARKGSRLVVGFALETGDGTRRARRKLNRKGADYIVLNDPSALGGARTRVTVIGRAGDAVPLAGTKRAVAEALVALERP